MSHHVEIFLDDEDKTWGWQCFEPDCDAVDAGFDDFNSAESGADQHAEDA